jgi:hypothetical protein
MKKISKKQRTHTNSGKEPDVINIKLGREYLYIKYTILSHEIFAHRAASGIPYVFSLNPRRIIRI